MTIITMLEKIIYDELDCIIYTDHNSEKNKNSTNKSMNYTNKNMNSMKKVEFYPSAVGRNVHLH